MRRLVGAGACAALAGGLLLAGAADAAGLVVRCAPSKVVCDVRARAPVDIQNIAVTAPVGRAVKSEPIGGLNQRRGNALLFLLQRGAQVRDGARECERLLAGAIHGSLGVFSFSDRVVTEADFGASEGELRKALANLKQVKPAKTALYKSLGEAIGRFDRPDLSGAQRKFLIVIGDARSEDDAGDEDSVVALARRLGVALIAIAMPTHNDRLSRLAERTGGIYQDVGAKGDLPQAFVGNFYRYLENGGLVRLTPTDMPANARLTFTAKLAGGQAVSAEDVVVAAAPTLSAASWLRWALDRAQANRLATAAGAASLVGLVLCVTLSAAVRRRRRLTPVLDARGTAEVIAEREQSGRFGGPSGPRDRLIVDQSNGGHAANPLAWLEVLDESGLRVPVTSRNTRIGRHTDNDIQINNNSVHRRHAVLHVTNEGTYVINDLATRNGVYVNGKRVDQQELADGDVIELGEVRVQFVAAPRGNGRERA